MSRPLALILIALPFSAASAESLLLAVASNFLRPAEALAAHFESTTGHSVAVSSGSTGKLYAQITQGAPHDILLAADVERPAILEASGHGVAGTRFTYAIGDLVLWSADAQLTGTDCREQLDKLGNRHLAIANPLSAPYGVAAKAFLESSGLLESVKGNLVYGENISQVLHFVASGNASFGLVAAAQLTDARLPQTACRWTVPTSLYPPLEQQAILLRAGIDKRAAREFMTYLRSPHGRDIVRSFGYTVPN